DSRGRIVPVSMTASIIYEDGEEVATVGTFTDLRDRIEMEQRLSEAEEELMKTERARVAAELAGMAAHELNQPLTSVLGYAEMLRFRVQEDARVSKVVETIYTQAERMAEIVRKIGNITRYETKVYGAKTMMMDLERSTGSGEGSGGMTPSPGPSNLAGGVRVAGLQPILPGDVVTSAASRNDHPTDPRYAIIRADTIDDERTGPMPRVQVSPPPQERASGTGPSHTESPAAEPGHGSPVTPSTLPSPTFLRSAAIFEDLSADNPPEHERTNHEGLPLLRRNEPPPKD
ncbi:MAG: histidine kinase dimerization/phospho-acceptor domain-containing protein, partial [Myxococcota bacterium]